MWAEKIGISFPGVFTDIQEKKNGGSMLMPKLSLLTIFANQINKQCCGFIN